ncbi:hypothetical protein [Williamsia sp.]|uniref:hypothetical protein n=1 Tax=Williamsia sp. TaxID=1872085 RepID=UPI002F92239F
MLGANATGQIIGRIGAKAMSVAAMSSTAAAGIVGVTLAGFTRSSVAAAAAAVVAALIVLIIAPRKSPVTARE